MVRGAVTYRTGLRETGLYQAVKPNEESEKAVHLNGELPSTR